MPAGCRCGAGWRDLVVNRKHGVSALGLQRVLGFGSYQTAWAWLHKLRRAMMPPDAICSVARSRSKKPVIGAIVALTAISPSPAIRTSRCWRCEASMIEPVISVIPSCAEIANPSNADA